MNEKHPILLVDDSEGDLKLLRRAFLKAGFNSPSQAVHSGEEAIAYLKGEGPYGDREQFPLPVVMLLDLSMPRKNGFEVLEWLRAQAVLKRITVVMLTASLRTEDVERAFDLGANSFLVKPVNFEDLTSMVRCLSEWLQMNQFPPLNDSVRR